MRSNRLLLNWEVERGRVREFLEGDEGVLHVYGGAAASPNQFSAVIDEEARNCWGAAARSCHVDQANIRTSTPAGVLAHIAESFNLDITRKVQANPYADSVLSNIRTVFGAVNISEVTISPSVLSTNDVEDLADWIAGYQSLATQRPILKGSLVIFHATEVLSTQECAAFGKHVWECALGLLMEFGLKIAFLIAADRGAPTGNWPPPRNSGVQLPTFLDPHSNEIVAQLASWLRDLELVAAEESSIASAHMLLSGCEDVDGVYRTIFTVARANGLTLEWQ